MTYCPECGIEMKLLQEENESGYNPTYCCSKCKTVWGYNGDNSPGPSYTALGSAP